MKLFVAQDEKFGKTDFDKKKQPKSIHTLIRLSEFIVCVTGIVWKLVSKQTKQKKEPDQKMIAKKSKSKLLDGDIDGTRRTPCLQKRLNWTKECELNIVKYCCISYILLSYKQYSKLLIIQPKTY